jgi:formylglycine-generating enzyme required for sulfatase activity
MKRDTRFSVTGRFVLVSVFGLMALVSAASATVPDAPTGLSATAGNGQVILGWTAVSGATSYNVYRSKTLGQQGSEIGARQPSASYTDTGLMNGTTYYYEVTAANASGESIATSQVKSTPFADLALVTVPGGTFQYDWTSGDLVTVSTFRMSANLITGDLYAAVTGLGDPSYFDESHNPVEQVSWYGALVFCNKLSMLEGKTPVYTIKGSTDPSTWGDIPTSKDATWDAVTANWSADGYRLPTGMEYVWAAMGGLGDSCPGDIVDGKNTKGFLKGYAGSKEPNGEQKNVGSYTWNFGNSQKTTHAVGTKLPNELGIYDLSGNLYEWCWDWSGIYPGGAKNDPRGPSSDTGTGRSRRGFGYNVSGGSVSNGNSSDPSYQDSSIGFRVVSP